MDYLDYKALSILMANGRATWTEIGNSLEMTGPAAAERVRRLEEQGVIRGYTTLIDPVPVGCGIAAFVAVTLERPEHRELFLQKISELEEIQECHHVAGEDDYFLKVRCRNTRDLDRIVSYELKGLPGVVKTRTTIVLETCKETPTVPLFPQ